MHERVNFRRSEDSWWEWARVTLTRRTQTQAFFLQRMTKDFSRLDSSHRGNNIS
jgi:hypothetical protein